MQFTPFVSKRNSYIFLVGRPTNKVLSVFIPAILQCSHGFSSVLFISLLVGLPLVVRIALLYTKIMLFNKLMINKARFTAYIIV